MSHELRTPLSAIIGFAEVLTETEMEVDEATQQEFLRDILAAGRHLLQLINDILDISKAEAGKMDFVPEHFEVEPAVRGVGAVAKALVSRKHQRLELRVEPGIGVVHHDPARFKQVLFNLVSNAVKFTPDGGDIRVTASRSDDAWLEVAVSDTGIGMKPEDQTRVFEEFQQIDSGHNREQQGTGLGLAIVRRFVRTMGGDVWVNSELGRGATFTFRIPPISPTEDLPDSVGVPMPIAETNAVTATVGV
jgi:protein-histidine pros-kinase